MIRAFLSIDMTVVSVIEGSPAMVELNTGNTNNFVDLPDGYIVLIGDKINIGEETGEAP